MSEREETLRGKCRCPHSSPLPQLPSFGVVRFGPGGPDMPVALSLRWPGTAKRSATAASAADSPPSHSCWRLTLLEPGCVLVELTLELK